jgi:hypothetical protein
LQQFIGHRAPHPWRGTQDAPSTAASGRSTTLKLTHCEFAEAPGLEIDTSRNWEQKQNWPDAAAPSLAMAFDKAADVVKAAAFEPVT